MDPGGGCKNKTEGQPDGYITAVFYGNLLIVRSRWLEVLIIIEVGKPRKPRIQIP
jgi:hypothetical protein